MHPICLQLRHDWRASDVVRILQVVQVAKRGSDHEWWRMSPPSWTGVRAGCFGAVRVWRRDLGTGGAGLRPTRNFRVQRTPAPGPTATGTPLGPGHEQAAARGGVGEGGGAVGGVVDAGRAEEEGGHAARGLPGGRVPRGAGALRPREELVPVLEAR
jgi:hypothetical protein